MKNIQKGSASVWLLIVVIVLIIAGGTYYTYKNKNFRETTPTSDTQTTQNYVVATTSVVTTQPASDSNLPPAIIVTNPTGGQVFHVGQQVSIKWKTQVAPWPTVTVMVVASTTDNCSEYTTNGSMGTCRGYVVHTGSDTGSYNWTIPAEYPDAGTYLVRIFPGGAKDVAALPETLRALNHEGYSLGGYGGSFIIEP